MRCRRGISLSRENHAVSCKVGEESDLIQNPLRFKAQLGREQNMEYGAAGRDHKDHWVDTMGTSLRIFRTRPGRRPGSPGAGEADRA